ncbi:MAG: CARDB domain-containing protein [Actinomycetota bacterium]
MRNGRRGYFQRATSAILLSTVVVGTSLLQPAGAAPGLTEIVSINTNGTQGNNISGRFAGPAISGNGLVVAFDSIATTLVSGDNNNAADVFVHDRTTGVTQRVSVTSTGGQANGTSTRPALDGAGNLVVFDSSATNLVSGDTNQSLDVFLRNRTTGTTQRVSVTSDEAQGATGGHSPSISDDGRFVAFVSTSPLVPEDTNNAEDIYVRDLVNGTTERVSVSSAGVEGNSSTTATSVSADGRWVVFSSFANNLVPNDTNGHFDSFIHDRQTGLTELVSVSSDEVQADAQAVTPSVSADGRFVAFWSNATNLVPGDTNERPDVFVRDRETGTTQRVSVSSDEEQSDGNSPEAGVRGFVAEGPDITPDGRFVVFSSSATNLVPGDTNTCPLFFEDPPGACPDAFVRDLVAGTTTRVNVSADGAEANDRSVDPAVSDGGTVFAFFSAAANLAPNDANVCPLFAAFPGNCPDIFVHDQAGNGGGGGDADLVVAKTDSRDPAPVGRRMRYTVTVTNQGPAAATQVSLVDDLPANVRVTSAASTVGSCEIQAGDVVCDIGSLDSGGTAVIRINVVPLRQGTLTNTVTVDAAESDPVPANNTDVETTQVVR